MCRTTNIDLLNKNEEVLFSRFHDKWHVACFQGLCINDQTKQPKWRFLLIRRFSLRSNQSELKPLQIFTPSCQVLNHQNDASFNLRTSIILELKNAVLLDLHALDLIVCWSPWHWEYVMRTETRGQTATGSQIVPISQTCSVLQHQCVFILLRVAKKDTVTMSRAVTGELTSFAVLCLDGLFQRSDVPEGQKEQDNEVPLVFYRCYLE